MLTFAIGIATVWFIVTITKSRFEAKGLFSIILGIIIIYGVGYLVRILGHF